MNFCAFVVVVVDCLLPFPAERCRVETVFSGRCLWGYSDEFHR